MSTDEANAERLVRELCKIPVGKLGGVVCLLEDLVKKIRDDDGSRVTKKVMLLMSLLESSNAVYSCLECLMLAAVCAGLRCMAVKRGLFCRLAVEINRKEALGGWTSCSCCQEGCWGGYGLRSGL